jgi:hypothetical protein
MGKWYPFTFQIIFEEENRFVFDLFCRGQPSNDDIWNPSSNSPVPKFNDGANELKKPVDEAETWLEIGPELQFFFGRS